MKDSTRKILDGSFTVLSRTALALIVLATAAFMIPIALNGVGAFVFRATVEHEKFLRENLDAELSAAAEARIVRADTARQKLYAMMSAFESADAAKPIRERLQAERKSAFAAARGRSDEFVAAVNSSAALRAEKIFSVSDTVFSGYRTALDAAVADARKMGATIPAAKILRAENDAFALDAKEFSDSLASARNIGYLKKSSLRRNMSKAVSEKIAELVDALESGNAAYETFRDGVAELLGPRDARDKSKMKLMRQKYGQTRLDGARRVFENSVAKISVKSIGKSGAETVDRVSTKEYFRGTPVEKMFDTVRDDFDAMLAPHLTAYFGFFTDNPIDANIFGGIFPMIVGTFYLTVGAMLIGAPLGIIAAIYFSEYAGGGRIVWLLRMCVGTLAGVPSIVFGLFGLAFLINTLKISEGKSVLAGAITLALLILPTIIRSCEEALKAVPNSYREAALGLGAGKWRAICGVILPAAFPSMLTGIIISMGRAAGETAPIIFTAATSTGLALGAAEIFSQPTPALPWNIYNICSEHEMAERVAHVQYGMVFTLMAIVLSLNFAAIWLRAKLQNKMGL